MILQERGVTRIEGRESVILLEYEYLTRALLENIEKEELERAFKHGSMKEEETLNELKKEAAEKTGISESELEKGLGLLSSLIKSIL